MAPDIIERWKASA